MSTVFFVNKILKLMTACAAVLASGAFFDARAAELVFAHVGGAGSLYQQSADEFTRRLNEALPPEYTAVSRGGGVLGNDTEVLAAVREGRVTFALPSTVMSSISETFGIFDLPFLIRDRDQVRRISDALLEPVLQPEARKDGLRILAVWENGFRQITNNIRPVRQPGDLRGLKLRVPKGVWREKAFRVLGAEPVPMALDEVYQGLQSGKIDGQENPLAQIKGSRFHEVQQYLTLSDHLYTPAYLVVGEEHFGRLPPDIQRIVTQTAREMQNWIYATAIRMESELIDQLGERMQSNQVDSQAFIEASRPLYGEFVRSVPGGAKLVDLVQELADAVPGTDQPIQ
jgi:TRAP-type transport system periplasmic protein